MKLVKVLAVLGLGFYFGMQTERAAELGMQVSATYDAFVEHWSRMTLPALPAELGPLVGQSATK